MDARSIISKLRQGQSPSRDELAWFAQGLADGGVSDAQAGAFAMGVCTRGLSDIGRVALTLGMRDSGRTLSWHLDGPVLDKHSTGGVGDCVSLILAPALAACGAYVPMISGRGLGHTGGTLDKLESIPGVTVNLDERRFRDVVARAGCAIVSATADIAPADRRLYAIRDVTATVESLDLITASILSKKLAAGLDGLVLDVKVGSGAFMKSLPEAERLAKALVDTANAAGCKTAALITDMNQPLAPALGNALEIAEIARVLTGDAKGRLFEITTALGGVVLANGGLATDVQDGAEKIATAIIKGDAAERFGQMIAAMGGPVEFLSNPDRFLPEANVMHEITAPSSGYITEIDGETLGLAVVDMGGGRKVETDRVDPSVGFSDMVKLGQKITKGQPLCRVHASRMEHAKCAAEQVRHSIKIGPQKPEIPPLFHERMG